MHGKFGSCLHSVGYAVRDVDAVSMRAACKAQLPGRFPAVCCKAFDIRLCLQDLLQLHHLGKGYSKIWDIALCTESDSKTSASHFDLSIGYQQSSWADLWW